MSVALRRGLYAITDAALLARRDLAAYVDAALRGGAVCVQYRDKGADKRRRREEAAVLRGLCRDHGATFIINDDVALAVDTAADGVHLGQGDAALEHARAQLGSGAIIGVSCYNQLARAEDAVARGADYVAFGRFFPSRTKPDAVPASPQLLADAKNRLSVPVVAIGGITAENGAALIAAGVDLLAVIDGVFGQPDIEAAARRCAALFKKSAE